MELEGHAELCGGGTSDGEKGSALEVVGFALVDINGVEGETPTLVEGVFTGEIGEEKLAWTNGTAGARASAVKGDVF